MIFELISIGSELLTGKTVNTNATFLGEELLKHGYKVSFIQTIEDKPEIITKALELAVSRADFILTTGGLGATGDDLTKECVARFFGKKLQYHPEIEKALYERFPNIPGHDTQATYPEEAILLENVYGTALGFIVEGKVCCLPGVPSQMKSIFSSGVVPYLRTHFQPEYHVKQLYIADKIENDVDPTLRALETRYPGVEIGICPSWGRLSVYCVGKNEKDVWASFAEIQKKFSESIYSTEDPDISFAVHTLLQKKKYTLACGESCTGGYLSSEMTKHGGASEYFLGSIVSYSNEAKENLLNVSSETLEQCGAVSEEMARAMVVGVKKAFPASLAIAITGIAGPTGGSKEKPVGTVWIALSNKEGVITTRQLNRGGDRKKIIEYATAIALQMIWRECR